MPSALVEKVRAKYPEYSDMSDDQLEASVLAKYPEYADLASPKARMTASVEAGAANATAGAQARGEAPGTPPLSAANFRRSDEIPGSGDPGTPGGSPARLSSMMVPAMIAPAAVVGPMGAATMAARGAAGSVVGSWGAGKLGLPPWLGGLVGGVGAAGGMNISDLVKMGSGGKVGLAKLLMGKFGPQAAAKAPGAAEAAPLGYTAESAMAYLKPGAQGVQKAAGATSAALPAVEAAAAPAARTLTPGVMGANPNGIGKLVTEGFTPAGRAAPAVSGEALAFAEKLQGTVAALKGQGLSPGQIASAVREANPGLGETVARKMVDDILAVQKTLPKTTAPLLSTGSRSMATVGGGKAQPYLGPARVPTDDSDLLALLQSSLTGGR